MKNPKTRVQNGVKPKVKSGAQSGARTPAKAGLTVRDVVARLEAQAPASAAERWDNVGLLVGDPDERIEGAVLSIDLTEGAIETAVRREHRLIINHHPCIFPRQKGLTQIVAGQLVYRAAREGVAVYSTHTNFDRCALEVVEDISRALGVQARGRLHDPSDAQALTKLAVYVPRAQAETVRAAVCAAGAGKIGDYDECSFALEGKGTFRGGAQSKPFLGQPGYLERASEVRVETIFPTGLTPRILTAMRESHPYEEVAYDLYPVLQKPTARGLVAGLGYGFWGDYAQPRAFSEVIKDVKKVFQIERLLLTEPRLKMPEARVKRIAFAAGKGTDFIGSAAAAGCDLFVTGEAGYHAALGAARHGERPGMAIAELGHRQSERFFLSTVSGWLSRMGLNSIILNEPTQNII